MNIDILSEEEQAEIRKIIAEADHILICCHKSPDGDAMGASLAWAEYLRSQNKFVTVVTPDAFPDFLRWMPGTEKIIRYDKHKDTVEDLFHKADTVFCLDFNGADRVDEMQQALESSEARKVMIDHHLNPYMETSLCISHPEMSSTSELIFRILWQLGEFDNMTKKMAVAIYCGMMTDTGGFTYNSTRSEIFYIISLLLLKHIDKDKIYRNVFNNYQSWAIRLRGYLMYKKLNVIDDLHAAYYSLSREEMLDFHFIKGDVEGLVNEPLHIKGLKLSISLREDDRRDNLVWVSLRSVDDFPCNEMAEQYFHGGGHKNASGGRLECSLQEAENLVRQVISSYGEQLKK